MSYNCAPHSACHSGLPQACSALDMPWNFRGTTMTSLYSRIGFIGSVTKGRWRLSWTNRRYGRNLGSLIRTNLETPTKWIEHPGSLRLKKVRPIQCSPTVKVVFIVVYDIDGVILHHAVPPRQMINTALSCTATFVHRSGGKDELGGTEPRHSSCQCKKLHPCCSHAPFCPLTMEDSGISTEVIRNESVGLRSLP